MSLDRAVYGKRLETVRRRLDTLGADGLFATPSSNLFYLTGISFSRSERLTALFLFKDGDPFVLCPAFEGDRLRGMSAVTRLHTWEETEDPFRLAASLFPGAGGVLAIEPSTAFDDVERLLAVRGGWKPISAAPLFTTLRMVKTPEEIAAMRRAIAVAVPRFEKAFGALCPGSVEADISHLFGSENVVQFGPSSALPHGASGPRLSPGTRRS
jgi:Xaa-Pro dipeptidase